MKHQINTVLEHLPGGNKYRVIDRQESATYVDLNMSVNTSSLFEG